MTEREPCKFQTTADFKAVGTTVQSFTLDENEMWWQPIYTVRDLQCAERPHTVMYSGQRKNVSAVLLLLLLPQSRH